MQPRIYLIGFMGSGKTTFGSSLARKIGYEFVDMDQLIEDIAGMTIPGIFNEHGEKIFRKWEHDVLMDLSCRENIVVATGGGAPCHGDMISIMNKNGITIYIQLTPDALKDRLLQSQTNRPLIHGKSEPELLEFITTLLDKREIFYNQATYIIDGDNFNPDHLVSLLRNS